MDDYRVSGLDLSEDMLALARTKCPGLTFPCGNLIGFRLQTDFDAMICLYGSIGFVKTADALRAALHSIARHLRPDGLAPIAPWSTMEEFRNMLVVDAAEKWEWIIARMEQVRLKEPKICDRMAPPPAATRSSRGGTRPG